MGVKIKAKTEMRCLSWPLPMEDTKVGGGLIFESMKKNKGIWSLAFYGISPLEKTTLRRGGPLVHHLPTQIGKGTNYEEKIGQKRNIFANSIRTMKKNGREKSGFKNHEREGGGVEVLVQELKWEGMLGQDSCEQVPLNTLEREKSSAEGKLRGTKLAWAVMRIQIIFFHSKRSATY